MNITIPDLSLVILIGASGSGKSSFAREHFLPTEVLSSDRCRALVSDDENDQGATGDAFDVLHYIAAKRLKAGRLTVVDATNVQPEARKPLVELARRHYMLPVAIVLDMPERVCQERNRGRPDRQFGPHVVRRQLQQLRRSVRGLQKEGFRHVFVLSSPEEVEAATIVRQPLWNDKRDERGPFDIIGDVHGCLAELLALLRELGYTVTEVNAGEGTPEGNHDTLLGEGQAPDAEDELGAAALQLSGPAQERDGAIGVAAPRRFEVVPPGGRKAVFLGDLVDRGPDTPGVLRLVMGMVEAGTALCVPGNHDAKLVRKLRGRDVQVAHGLAESLEQLDREPPEFRARAASFLDGLVSHYVLDGGALVVAHAGLKQEMQGRGARAVREFCLYGETTGETDEFGLPVRYPWAAEYRGRAAVVYGHTPVPEPEWLNGTINIDTGCVFGGRLTALRYPERELVSVPATRTYAEPARPFLVEPAKGQGREQGLSAQQEQDEVLEIGDVIGKRVVATGLRGNVTVREENAIAALEVMSRFAADPKWLLYLPPAMSPSETSARPDLLEHPAEAFGYYRGEGVRRVVCEEKHMGSRAVVVVCRDEEAARRRFGVEGGESGIVYTRTGRRFFEIASLEAAFLDRVRGALGAAGIWEELGTDWVLLDCELMPWSAKARELLKRQYAAVGAASGAALAHVVGVLGQAEARGAEVGQLLTRMREREDEATLYRESYRRYCWPVASLADLKLAPFHLLASEGKLHTDRDHAWHMETLARVCRGDPELLLATPYRPVDLDDPESEAAAVAWWEELTGRGGEGMVVKPLEYVARGRKGLAQPAVKCRGREYLRIIYGPEYTAPHNLERLRSRGLGRKRALALSEFALGLEGLDRWVRREPLRRVHECAFAVLALESEPVDPRL